MTPKEKLTNEEKKQQAVEEICENTRAIRRVTNRILDHLHEYQTGNLRYFNFQLSKFLTTVYFNIECITSKLIESNEI